jgi:hypothetical protein
VFIRYSAQFFVAISFFGMMVMAPIYAVGDPLPSQTDTEDNGSVISDITIFNVLASPHSV